MGYFRVLLLVLIVFPIGAWAGGGPYTGPKPMPSHFTNYDWLPSWWASYPYEYMVVDVKNLGTSKVIRDMRYRGPKGTGEFRRYRLILGDGSEWEGQENADTRQVPPKDHRVVISYDGDAFYLKSEGFESGIGHKAPGWQTVKMIQPGALVIDKIEPYNFTDIPKNSDLYRKPLIGYYIMLSNGHKYPIATRNEEELIDWTPGQVVMVFYNEAYRAFGNGPRAKIREERLQKGMASDFPSQTVLHNHTLNKSIETFEPRNLIHRWTDRD